ncbi:MAG: vitamin K epoxide reductase family protein [Chloroflexota bacterium]
MAAEGTISLEADVSQRGPASAAPPGWDYNPSTWSQRLPIILLALVGFAIATFLALYQWRILPDVWEPFFGEGSRIILNSAVSHVLPVPDAALGAFGYLLDAVTGAIGGRGRWRTMPWIVILFGLAVGPLGAVSIMLVIFQPVLFDAWCTLCLASAVVSLVMIGPAMDEFLASLQELKRARDRGGSVWRAFWGLAARPVGASGRTSPEASIG